MSDRPCYFLVRSATRHPWRQFSLTVWPWSATVTEGDEALGSWQLTVCHDWTAAAMDLSAYCRIAGV